MALISKLEAIGDAIREKTGKTDLLTLDGMAEAVAGIQAGGGGDALDTFIERSITEVRSNAASVSSYSFYMFSKLKTVDLPQATSIKSKAFSNCNSLENVNLPKVETIYDDAFYGCRALKSLDLPRVSIISKDAFRGCYGLNTLVIRRTDMVCELSGLLTSTDIDDGTGYIYVPDALVEDYKAATNWSTYASQIRPFSEYVEVTE